MLAPSANAGECADFKSETLAIFKCNAFFTECKEILADGEFGRGTSSEEREVAKGGKKYEEACGYAATMRRTVCIAYKENNPGDTSSLRYKNNCYYELDNEADLATHGFAAVSTLATLAAISALAF